MKVVAVVTVILVLLAFTAGGVGVVAAETVDTQDKDKPIKILDLCKIAASNSDLASLNGEVPCEVGEVQT